MKKITGHLEEKNGKWYAAVNHYGPDNKRHVKWYSLDVEAKRGNNRRSEDRLTELLEKLNRGMDYISESLTPAERERQSAQNSPKSRRAR